MFCYGCTLKRIGNIVNNFAKGGMKSLRILSLLVSVILCKATPHISIITSVYKGDAFIEGFLRDIVQQTIFEQCELILINAHSPGHEEEIILQYMQTHTNIIYHKLDHDPGLYAVWNIGIGMARGAYITNANLDDRLKFDCYEQHKKMLDTYPEVDLVYSDFYVTRYPHETFEHNKHSHVRMLPEFSWSALLQQPLPNNHPMWRKSMHAHHGLFDTSYKYAGDWEMWLRAAYSGAQFKKVHGIYGLYYYNPHGLSTAVAHTQQLAAEEQRMFAHYLKN